jgi:PAS domain S-box-containing protein
VLKSGKHSPEFYADLWRTINAGNIWRGEMTNRRKDGSLYIEDMTITPVRDSSGEISGFIAIKQDVTVRKRAEETVRELQRQQRTLLDNIPGIAWVKDKESRYVVVNDALSKAYGHAPEEIIGKTDLDFFPAELAESYRADDKHVMDSRKRKHVEEPFEDAKGDRTWIDTIKSPIVDDLGEVVGTAGIARDITKRKQAEEALRENEERFRIAAETANDMVYEWDLKQSVQWLGKIDEMLGYEPGEFPRTMNGFAASVHPEDLERTMAAIQAHLEGRAPYAIEYRVRRKDGVYRWWSARGAAARTPYGKPTRLIGSVTDFTERKQAEERLTQEHDLSEAILNNMPGLFFLITEQGRFLRWNRQLETVSGYSGEEIARMHPLDIFPAEHKGLVAEQILQVFKTGHSKIEANLLTKQGEQLPYYFFGGTVIVDGQPCLAGTGVDITERKQAETALRESDARYRALFNESPDGILIADIETKTFKYANPVLCRMLGYTENELRTMGVLDIHPKDALQSVVAEFEALARGDKTLATDIPCLRKDGSVVHADINSTKITIDDRLRNVGFFRDITERKRAEEEAWKMLLWQQGVNLLQHSLLAPAPLKDKLRSVTDNIVRLFGADFCRIWLIRPGDLCERGCVHAEVKEGPHVCRYRDRCLHLLASSGRYTHIDGKGHRRVPFGAYKIGRIASGEDHKFLTNDVTHDPLVHNHQWARELGLVSFAGYQLRIPGAETLGVLALFAKHPISPTEDAILGGLSGAVAQVIQQAQAEEEIHRLNAELEQRVQERTAELAAINKELETFSYSVSHDLRSPLRGIDGFSKLLVEDYGDKLDDTAKDYLQRIGAAAQRMAELIDHLLGLSGITRTELCYEPVNLSELARVVGAELRQREPDRQVELLIADGLAAEGDRQLLRVALENLLGNAWKFTGKMPQARVEFGATQQDGATAYFVRDNGAGFDMQYAHNLFGAFQRLHGVHEFEGTGIGLATVQRIIHRHGGRVWAEGEVNKGATFYFTL